LPAEQTKHDEAPANDTWPEEQSVQILALGGEKKPLPHVKQEVWSSLVRLPAGQTAQAEAPACDIWPAWQLEQLVLPMEAL